MKIRYFNFISIILIIILSGTIIFAQHNLDSLLKLQNKLKSEEEKIDNQIALAKEYIHRYEYSEALNYLLLAKTKSEAAGYKTGKATALRNIGNIYSSLGLYPKSLDAYLESLKICEELNDTLNIARNYNNIGLIYQNQKHFQKALQYYNNAIKLKKLLKDSSSLVSTMNNFGITLMVMDSLEKAEQIYKEALNIAEKYSDNSNIANIKTNLGIIYSKSNKNEIAISHFKEALEIFNDIQDKEGIVVCYDQLGNVFKNEKKYDDAIKYFNLSLQLADSIKSLENIHKSAFSLYSIYSEFKEWKKALDYYIKYENAKDSLFSIENSNKLIEFEKSYEYQKKENEILSEKKASDEKYKTIIISIIIITIIIIAFSIILSIYYKQKVKAYKKSNELNSELQSKNKELEEVNFTKDKFFSIIAHDLKNPLGNFKAVTSLMAESYEAFSENEKIEYIKIIKDSSQHLYSLLENLLEWSRSQRGLIKINKIDFNLNNSISQIFDLMRNNANAKKIKLENFVSDEFNIFADVNLFNTVIRNLVSNAIKFTKENGTISTNAFTEEENVIISVKDTGIGMEQAKLNKLFRIDVNISTSGTANEEGTGLGLILCKEFTEKQGGKIWVESEVGKGASFFISLPKK
ncbi:MAG TPA: tetratricopeptide repeat-containing sensor histidine kinase [Candidatus Kapabacteria bacterium]|nr:tetratricopeptide repeat-containing sensor histidine kinase [Candidatus Kapabacteria bacterium]